MRERTTTHSNGKQKAHKERREKKKRKKEKKREATTAAVWEFGVWRRASKAANGLFLIAGEEVNKAPVVNLVVADVALVKHPTQQVVAKWNTNIDADLVCGAPVNDPAVCDVELGHSLCNDVVRCKALILDSLPCRGEHVSLLRVGLKLHVVFL